MIDAVEGCQNVERSIHAAADFDDLAETSARAAGAARIRTQLLAPEDQRRLRLCDLDRRAAYAAGIGRGRQTILGKTRAGAAVARHRHRESVIAAGAAARLSAHIQIPQAGCSFGRHPLGNDLTQAAEHHVGQHLADDMARRHRRRLRRIEDRALGCGDGQQRERPCIVRNLRGDHAAEAEHGVSGGIGKRHIDAELRGARGTVEVDVNAPLRYRQRRRERDRRIIAVDDHAVAPDALRQLGDLGEHSLPRAVTDEIAKRIERRDFEFAHHLDKALAADIVAAGQRIGVALGVDRQTRVAADHRHQRFIDDALIDQLQHRDIEPLHEDVGGIRPETDTADIHQMAGAGKQRDRLAVLEARRGDDEVVEVAGPHPGIVGDVGVARLHRLDREMRDEMLDRLGHGIDVARRTRHRLRQHAALEVEHTG